MVRTLCVRSAAKVNFLRVNQETGKAVIALRFPVTNICARFLKATYDEDCRALT